MEDATWTEFQKTITWRELLNEYNEAVQRMDRYTIANLETDVPPAVRDTCQRLTALWEQLMRVARTSAMVDEPAPREAVKIILSIVGRVRREVPEHFGRA